MSIFAKEIRELKDYFSIPGLAVMVRQENKILYEEYLGQADLASGKRVDSTTVFPIASLTKNFAATLLMQLVEEQKLSLDTPMNAFISDPEPGDSIQVKHVLSHTSQGPVGEQFYYSYRYGWLSPVIEEVSGMGFAQAMQERILDPLELSNTFLLKDSSDLAKRGLPLASPYRFEGENKPGFIDYGYSSAAGLASTLGDLNRFYQALEQGRLLEMTSLEKLFHPFQPGLPHGQGFFTQEVNGVDIVWGYGQYDCYSSLYLYVPERKISLLLLANNNLMSDPARLIYGDATSSLFVLSFLKNLIFEAEYPILDTPFVATNEAIETSWLQRELLLAQALSESFLARFEPERMQTSVQLLEKTFGLYPNYTQYADLSTLHNLMFLKDIAFYMEMEPFRKLDRQTLAIGLQLLQEDPLNPYINYYLGVFHARNGNFEAAKPYFRQIVEAKNFSRFWYTAEAEQWLKGE